MADRDGLAGKSQALRAALKAVERLGKAAAARKRAAAASQSGERKPRRPAKKIRRSGARASLRAPRASS